MNALAKITAASETRVFQIKKWLGINEHADGDTRLKMGEAAEMRNWRITDGGSLQVRPGTNSLFTFDGPVRGMWSGNVDGEHVLVCAADGQLWKLDIDGEAKESIGILTDAHTEFFGYSEKLYMLNGVEYKSWDGEILQDVEGYRPLVVTAAVPTGGGTTLEQANKLTGAKRVRFSPDGTATVFQLPETDIASVDYVTDLANGESINAYTADLPLTPVTPPSSSTSSTPMLASSARSTRS